MALSQRHSGKILVPWFNSHEWRHVYSLIYSQTSTISDKHKAVELLQIWKTRMPILFAGLEGTLIILKVMIKDKNGLSEEELTSFYGLAIMRFLNLCAANSDQQGTFFHIAKKRKLPDWLVNIRHDLAHSQKPLSLFMLEKGIKYCFDWLRREYWELQDKKIEDFSISNVISEDSEQKLKIYCEFVVASIDEEKLTPQILSMLREVQLLKQASLKTVLKKLTQSKKFDNFVVQNIPDLLINNEYLFKMPFEDDTEEILDRYIESWQPLMQFMHENYVLINFIKKLHNICLKNNDRKMRKLSSLWLNEIFQGLLQARELQKIPLKRTKTAENGHCYRMYLHGTTDKLLADLKAFTDEAIETPHIYLRNYLKRQNQNSFALAGGIISSGIKPFQNRKEDRVFNSKTLFCIAFTQDRDKDAMFDSYSVIIKKNFEERLLEFKSSIKLRENSFAIRICCAAKEEKEKETAIFNKIFPKTFVVGLDADGEIGWDKFDPWQPEQDVPETKKNKKQLTTSHEYTSIIVIMTWGTLIEK